VVLGLGHFAKLLAKTTGLQWFILVLLLFMQKTAPRGCLREKLADYCLIF